MQVDAVTSRPSNIRSPPSLEPVLSHTLIHLLKVVKDKHTSLQRQTELMKEILTKALESAPSGEEIEMRDTYITELEAANDELTQKITRMSEQHFNLKGKIDLLNTETARLKQQYARLESVQVQTERESVQLKKETADLKAEYRTLGLKYATLELTFKGLEGRHGALTGKTDSLEKKYEELKRNYVELEKNNKTLKDDSKELKDHYGNLETQYDELKKDTQSLRAKYETLNTEYADLQRFVDGVLASQGKIQGEMKEQVQEADRFKHQGNFLSRAWKTIEVDVWVILPLPIKALIQLGKRWYSH